MYYVFDELPKEVGAAISKVINAMREALERKKDCEYCMGDDPKELPGMGEAKVFGEQWWLIGYGKSWALYELKGSVTA